MKLFKDSKFFRWSLLIVFLIFLSSTAAYAIEANDTEGHWAGDEITKWISNGLATGYPDGSFGPNKFITRAEFITLINKAFGYTEENNIEYSDVLETDWHSKEIKKAQAAGYIGGYPDGTMRPSNSISRQEAAIIISNIKTLESNPDYARNYDDFEAMQNWNVGQIGAASEAGYLSGYPDGYFKPLNPITRAEAIVSLDRALEEDIWIINKSGKYGIEGQVKVFDGDIHIDAPGVELQNITIAGDLTITENVGEGEIALNNVIVEGDTYIKGGGSDSIYINGGDFKNIIIQKSEGKLRIVMVHDRGATVMVAEEAEDTEIIFEGTFDNINVKTGNVKLIMQGETKVNEIQIYEQSKDIEITTSKDTLIEVMTVNTTTKVVNEGRIINAKGTASNNSEYQLNLPENLQSVSTGSGRSSHTAPRYNLSLEVNPQEAGVVTGSGNYRAGDTINLTATANTGYGFVNWTKDEIAISTEASFEYTMTSSGTTIVANFEDLNITTYPLSVSANNGIVTGEGNYESGDSVTLEVTPPDDYWFVKWTDANGDEVSTDNPYTFIMPATSLELTAIFQSNSTQFAGGEGSEISPFEVATPSQLNQVRSNLDKHFIQTANIDLSEWSWMPIGGQPTSVRFVGSYDGNGFKIEDLSINRPTTDNVGLFGFISGAVIENVTLENINVHGRLYTGGLVGDDFAGSTINNVSVTGNVTGEEKYIGGLIGAIRDGTIITNSFTDCIVVGKKGRVGGMVGFSYNSSIISSFSNSNVTNESGLYAGGLVGESLTSSIENCFATGDVTGITGTGGLAGSVGPLNTGDVSTISKSYATGNVTGGNSYTGGLVGTVGNNCSVINSYATGNITGSDYVGGLLGVCDGELEKSHSVSVITGNDYVGGLIGHLNNGNISDSFFDKDISKVSEAVGNVSDVSGGTNTINMVKDTIFTSASWDFNTIWTIVEDESYPYLLWQNDDNIPYAVIPESEFGGGSGTSIDPWLISEPKHLNNMRNYLGSEHADKHFKLFNDIDLEDYLSIDGDEYNDGKGWRPIGDNWSNLDNEFFAGTLDGDGNAILNLTINRPTDDFVGLFGVLSPKVNALGSSEIINLRLENASIIGKSYTGAIAGFNAGRIIDCSVEGIVTGKSNFTGGLVGYTERDIIAGIMVSGTVTGEEEYTGGLVGYTIYGTIDNCNNEADVVGSGNYTGGIVGSNSSLIEYSNNSGNVTGEGHNTGGLVGEARNSGNIEFSYNIGNIIGNGNNVGGIAGYNLARIRYSYSTGNVTGGGNGTGGLVGYNRYVVSDSYSTSNVNGYINTGGLVGKLEGRNSIDNATIARTYSVGSVDGVDIAGGLVGHSESSFNTVQNSYWDTETSDMSSSAEGIGKTTSDLIQKSTYPTSGYGSWDFNTVWGIDDTTYPYLRSNTQNPKPTPSQ